jgi:hypothetical protein
MVYPGAVTSALAQGWSWIWQTDVYGVSLSSSRASSSLATYGRQVPVSRHLSKMQLRHSLVETKYCLFILSLSLPWLSLLVVLSSPSEWGKHCLENSCKEISRNKIEINSVSCASVLTRGRRGKKKKGILKAVSVVIRVVTGQARVLQNTNRMESALQNITSSPPHMQVLQSTITPTNYTVVIQRKGS